MADVMMYYIVTDVIFSKWLQISCYDVKHVDGYRHNVTDAVDNYIYDNSIMSADG